MSGKVDFEGRRASNTRHPEIESPPRQSGSAIDREYAVLSRREEGKRERERQIERAKEATEKKMDGTP